MVNVATGGSLLVHHLQQACTGWQDSMQHSLDVQGSQTIASRSNNHAPLEHEPDSWKVKLHCCSDQEPSCKGLNFSCWHELQTSYWLSRLAVYQETLCMHWALQTLPL
ncbi:hypothetical protein ABBQ32_012717 [Trebouxia sp. C0010 RCD-2024]